MDNLGNRLVPRAAENTIHLKSKRLLDDGPRSCDYNCFKDLGVRQWRSPPRAQLDLEARRIL